MAIITSIEERLTAVQTNIAAACERVERNAAEVRIVGVTKTHPASVVKETFNAGLVDFGENRAQELLPKAVEIESMGLTPRWHFVGHLQRNKVSQVLTRISALHSLDSIRLANEIEHRSELLAHLRDSEAPPEALACYLEVNVSGEVSKEGVEPKQLSELLRELNGYRYIEIVGLMTVAPLVNDPEEVRPVFRRLNELADAHGLNGRSMGMTDDYVVAIEEGATVVRLGRVLFGARDY